jgi:hypothetical protein
MDDLPTRIPGSHGPSRSSLGFIEGLTSAFHVIGSMFNSYADGNPANVIYGDQTYNIPPGGTAMFELQIPDPGLYPFLTHSFAYADLGSIGLIKVDPATPAPPRLLPDDE